MKSLRKAFVLFLVLVIVCSMSLPAAAAIKYSKVKAYINLELWKDARIVKVGKFFYIAMDDLFTIFPDCRVVHADELLLIFPTKKTEVNFNNIWLGFKVGTKTLYYKQSKEVKKYEDYLTYETFMIGKQVMVCLTTICLLSNIPINYDEENNAVHLGQKYVDKRLNEIEEKSKDQMTEYRKKQEEERKKRQAEEAKAKAAADAKAADQRVRNYTRSDWTKATTSKKWTIASEIASYLTKSGTKASSEDVFAAIELAIEYYDSTSLLSLAKIGLKY